MAGELSVFFSPGHSYNIDLEIDMPESEVNYGAGTFMVSSLFYDAVSTLHTTSKPARVSAVL